MDIPKSFIGRLIYQLWYPFYTLWFIIRNGWKEYRIQRERYDNHMRLQNYGNGKYSKKKEIEMINAAKKVRK